MLFNYHTGVHGAAHRGLNPPRSSAAGAVLPPLSVRPIPERIPCPGGPLGLATGGSPGVWVGSAPGRAGIRWAGSSPSDTGGMSLCAESWGFTPANTRVGEQDERVPSPSSTTVPPGPQVPRSQTQHRAALGFRVSLCPQGAFRVPPALVISFISLGRIYFWGAGFTFWGQDLPPPVPGGRVLCWEPPGDRRDTDVPPRCPVSLPAGSLLEVPAHVQSAIVPRFGCHQVTKRVPGPRGQPETAPSCPRLSRTPAPSPVPALVPVQPAAWCWGPPAGAGASPSARCSAHGGGTGDGTSAWCWCQ